MQLFASYRCVFREDGIDFFELHQVFCSIQILSRLTTVFFLEKSKDRVSLAFHKQDNSS